jgi:hypothetical protein
MDDVFCRHQVMEAATVLLSPEVCLDPSLPPEQRAVADTPPLPEVRNSSAAAVSPLMHSVSHTGCRVKHRSMKASGALKICLLGAVCWFL